MSKIQTFWLTGLSGSGKTTLGTALAERLVKKGVSCKVIDGDELRAGLCSDLGFTREDRRENIRRVAEVCRILNSIGVTVVVALISPYREDRETAQKIIGQLRFREIWIAAPLEVCERRDPKGLYRKARLGEIQSFTGVSDPYEAPIAPYLTLDTHKVGIDECIQLIESMNFTQEA